MSDIALQLISVSKLITPHVKKYFLNNQVLVILDLKRCEYLLKEQNESVYTENINYTSCTVKLGIIESIEHSLTHGQHS